MYANDNDAEAKTGLTVVPVYKMSIPIPSQGSLRLIFKSMKLILDAGEQ